MTFFALLCIWIHQTMIARITSSTSAATAEKIDNVKIMQSLYVDVRFKRKLAVIGKLFSIDFRVPFGRPVIAVCLFAVWPWHTSRNTNKPIVVFEGIACRCKYTCVKWIRTEVSDWLTGWLVVTHRPSNVSPGFLFEYYQTRSVRHNNSTLRDCHFHI